jgi:hypothetical protein
MCQKLFLHAVVAMNPMIKDQNARDTRLLSTFAAGFLRYVQMFLQDVTSDSKQRT